MRSYLKNMRKHNKHLSRYACKDKEAVRINKITDDIRTPFFRDIDKILYTLSYVRYIDKTQVFSLQTNDMISKRMMHIQLVSKVARTIGRGLNLNEDLIEAACLGHDLGHVPFGHVGERILNEISVNNGEGYFNHNVQSVRTLMNIENKGKGSNVTIQVLDAILCHNGEKLLSTYIPVKKNKEDFLDEYNKCYFDRQVLNNLKPMTLEGCVVRVSDVVAYIGKDIEDAIMLGKFDRKDYPKKIRQVLGNTNSEIVNTIVMDIIKNSIGKNYIKMSNEVYNAFNNLIEFNYKNIYLKANSKKEVNEIKLMFNSLFDKYYEDVKNKNKNSQIYIDFLNSMSKDYIKNTTDARKTIDYISGMTDTYFINQYNSNLKFFKNK